MAKSKRTEKHESHNPKHRVLPFWPPWLLGPVVLAAGATAHALWGHSLPAMAIVPVVILVAFTALAVLTHKYAAPRHPVQRWHATISVAVWGSLLTLLEMFGTGGTTHVNALAQATAAWGLFFAASWNIRRLQVIKGDGEGDHGEDWHGILKPRNVKVTAADGKQTKARVRLSSGQTAQDVQGVLRNIGSDLGTITNGVRVVDTGREGEVDVSLLFEDVLTDAAGWNGAEFIGGSIADGWGLGINEQAVEVRLNPAGDYARNIAPGHVKYIGMPRSGKGVAAVVMWVNLRARRDVFPVVSDHAKGEQMLGMLRPGMPPSKAWVNTDLNGAKGQAHAVFNAIKARNKALGDGGFSSWEPRAFTEGFMWNGQHIHMPAVVYHIEEFAEVGTKSPDVFTKIGEQALSAGIFLVVSTQRASHDRFPTSLRSLIANGVCYGAFDDIDVGFALPDDAVDGGVSPAQWQTRFPGRAMAAVNGAEPGMERIPFKTYFASDKDAFESYVRESMAHCLPLAPDLDPCTAEAFGAPYAEYLGLTPAPAPVSSEAPTVQLPKPVGRPPAEEEDDMTEQEEIVDTDDPNEEEYVREPAPEGCDTTGIDPRAPIPDGPDTDMTPPPFVGRQGRTLNADEKRVLFREILQRLADDGETEVSTGRLVDIWREELGHPEQNQAPAVSRFINDASEKEGTLERLKRGRFRITLRPRVDAGTHGA